MLIFFQLIADLTPNFGLGLMKLTLFSQIRTTNGVRGREWNLEPLNPWPRPIIGTIHAKSTEPTQAQVWNHATSRTRAGFEPVNA